MSRILQLFIAIMIVLGINCYVDICAPILAEIAYYDESTIKQFTCSQCKLFIQKCQGYDGIVKEIKTFTHSQQQLQFYSIIKQNKLINTIFILVAFRGVGSSNQQTLNWIKNLGQQKVSYTEKGCSNCSVHKTLYNSYSIIKTQLMDYLNATIKNYNSSQVIFNVSFIGHGFGGALATFAALSFESNSKNIFNSLITYGQPRIGDSKFASFLVQTLNKTQRNIHFSDIVPHYPPQSSGFIHYNMQYWYQKSMKTYKICLSENPLCSNSINIQNYSIEDNSIKQYVKITQNYNYDINCSVFNKSIRYPVNTQIIAPVQVSFHYIGFEIPEQVWLGVYTLLSQDFPVCFNSSKTDVIFETNKTISDNFCDFGTYLQPYNYTFQIVGKVQVNNYLKRQQCKGQIHLEIY